MISSIKRWTENTFAPRVARRTPKKERNKSGASLVELQHFLSSGTRGLVAGPCKIRYFSECQQARGPCSPLEAWRRRSGSGSIEEETRRPPPKKAIVEAGLPPHPGPPKTRAAETPAAEEAEEQQPTKRRMMKKTHSEGKLAPPPLQAAKKTSTEQQNDGYPPLGIPTEHNQNK